MKAIGRLRQCGDASLFYIDERQWCAGCLTDASYDFGFLRQRWGWGSARLTARSSLLTAAGSPTRRCTFLWILQVYIHSLCLWPGTEPGAAGVSLCLFNCFCGLSSVPGVGLKLDVNGPNFSDSIKGLLGFVYFVSWAQWIWKRAIYAGDSSHHSIAQM